MADIGESVSWCAQLTPPAPPPQAPGCSRRPLARVAPPPPPPSSPQRPPPPPRPGPSIRRSFVRSFVRSFGQQEVGHMLNMILADETSNKGRQTNSLHFTQRPLKHYSVAPAFAYAPRNIGGIRRKLLDEASERLARRPRQPPPPLTAARARERAPDSTRATAQASRITIVVVAARASRAAWTPGDLNVASRCFCSEAMTVIATAGLSCFVRGGASGRS